MNPNEPVFLNILRAYYGLRREKLCGRRLCVCLSGGADSVALLRGTIMLAPEFGFSVVACHFNHLIRGGEADRDESFCIDLCERLHIELFRGRDDVPAYAKTHKMSLEEAARECRYAYFRRNLDSGRFDYYATAHNMNDDAETLLMNLVRGSGSYGGASIAEENGKLLRPMLKAGREDEESFLAGLGQDFVHDSTNDLQEYTRNYLRKTVIPELQKINPKAVEALSGFASACRDDREYFESVSEKYSDADLSGLPKSLKDRIILRKYKDFSGRIANSGQLNTIIRALDSKTRAVISIDGETEVIVDSGRVAFVRSSEDVPEYPEQQLRTGENTLFGGRIKVFIGEKPENAENLYNLLTNQLLKADKICGELYARQRRTGDRIRVRGINKSLKKLFIDARVPAELRDVIPVICDETGILYVPFTAVDDRVFTKSENGAIDITVCGNTEKGRWQRAYEE